MALNYPSDNIIACNHTKKCLFPKSLYTLHFAVSTQFVDICVVIQKVGTTCILFYFSILNIVHKSLPSILTGPESLENFGTQSYYEIKTCSHCFVLWQYKKKITCQLLLNCMVPLCLKDSLVHIIVLEETRLIFYHWRYLQIHFLMFQLV